MKLVSAVFNMWHFCHDRGHVYKENQAQNCNSEYFPFFFFLKRNSEADKFFCLRWEMRVGLLCDNSPAHNLGRFLIKIKITVLCNKRSDCESSEHLPGLRFDSDCSCLCVSPQEQEDLALAQALAASEEEFRRQQQRQQVPGKLRHQ